MLITNKLWCQTCHHIFIKLPAFVVLLFRFCFFEDRLVCKLFSKECDWARYFVLTPVDFTSWFELTVKVEAPLGVFDGISSALKDWEDKNDEDWLWTNTGSTSGSLIIRFFTETESATGLVELIWFRPSPMEWFL